MVFDSTELAGNARSLVIAGAGLSVRRPRKVACRTCPALGPFCERHLAHKGWRYPLHVTQRLRLSGAERRCLLVQRGKLFVKIQETTVVKARAHAAGIPQTSRRLVDAEQKGAEPDAGALWRRVSHDDELLPLGAFDLDPIVRATRDIPGRLPLGHDSLESHAACGCDQVRRRGAKRLAKTNVLVLARRDQLGEQLTTQAKWLAANIPSRNER